MTLQWIADLLEMGVWYQRTTLGEMRKYYNAKRPASALRRIGGQ
jgi:hypothetical protein